MNVRLSAAIMAHPVRREAAEALSAALGGVRIVYDEVAAPSKDPAQRWATGARAWSAYDPAADWHLVIQDDAVVCRDLLAGTALLLGWLPPYSVASLYLGGHPGSVAYTEATTAADRDQANWIRGRRLIWGPAIAAPTPAIEPMLAACADRHEPYDSRLGAYFEKAGYATYYAWPSLVDHAGMPSLLDHNPGRHARRFIGADASALDIDPRGRVVHVRGATRSRRDIFVGTEHPDLMIARRSTLLRVGDRKARIRQGITVAERDAEIVTAHPALWEPLRVDYTADSGSDGPALRGGVPAASETATAAPGERRELTTPAREVRAWARENGYEVPARGKLPDDVVNAYEVAHGQAYAEQQYGGAEDDGES